jgi:hypothetical protein
LGTAFGLIAREALVVLPAPVVVLDAGVPAAVVVAGDEACELDELGELELLEPPQAAAPTDTTLTATSTPATRSFLTRRIIWIAVTPASFTEFFAACAGVAGALIGLLFVAITVAHERLIGEGAEQGHRIRASAALTAFTNAFVVSLFALIPGVGLGWPAAIVGLLGLLFVAGSTLSLVRVRRDQPLAPRDLLLIIGLLATFALEVVYGIQLGTESHNQNAAQTIAVLVVVCFVIGIARAWELVEGPSVGLGSELLTIARGRSRRDERSDDERGD